MFRGVFALLIKFSFWLLILLFIPFSFSKITFKIVESETVISNETIQYNISKVEDAEEDEILKNLLERLKTLKINPRLTLQNQK